MACEGTQSTLVDWSTTQSLFLVPGGDHAPRLQNRCELCSNTDIEHPWKWLKRRNIVRRTNGLEGENKPRLTKSLPQVPSNPTSSAFPLGQEGMGTPQFPFPLLSLYFFSFFVLPQLLCWVISQTMERSSPGHFPERFLRDLPWQPGWDAELPSQCWKALKESGIITGWRQHPLPSLLTQPLGREERLQGTL